MTKSHYLGLLLLLLAESGLGLPSSRLEPPDGGPISSTPSPSDAGTLPFSPNRTALDGGSVTPLPRPSAPDASTPSALPNRAQRIKWPEDLQPLATLDGPAILAANAALQRVLERFPKEYQRNCAYSARAMEVIVGQQEGMYFVRINRRLDKCGRASPGSPGFSAGFDWFELYAVSPDGQVLERYPYYP